MSSSDDFLRQVLGASPMRSCVTGIGAAVSLLGASGCCDGCSNVQTKARGDAPSVVWSAEVAHASHGGAVHLAWPGDQDVVVAATVHGDLKIGSADLEASRKAGVGAGMSAAGDVAVWKLGKDGKPRWGLRFGDPAPQSVAGLAVTGAGTVFVGGRFEGSMAWGDATWKSEAGKHGGFVGSIDPAGIPGWGTYFDAVPGKGAEKKEGRRESKASVLAVGTDALGRLFVMGQYSGTFRVNGRAPIVDSPERVGGTFFARFDAAGTMRWFRLASYPDTDEKGKRQALRAFGQAMAVTEHGNLVLVGTARGEGRFVQVPLASHEGGSLFVSVWNQSGEPLWTRPFLADGSVRDLRVAVAGDGSIYLGGVTRGRVVLGEDEVQPETDDEGALFVAKLEASGEPNWLKRVGPTPWGSALGLSVLGDAGLVVAASTPPGDASLDFGGKALFTQAPAAAKGMLYAVAFDPEGEHRWSRGFIAEGIQSGGAVAVDSGRIALAGLVQGEECNPPCKQSQLSHVYVAELGK